LVEQFSRGGGGKGKGEALLLQRVGLCQRHPTASRTYRLSMIKLLSSSQSLVLSFCINPAQ
jgi:hypothetical protein